MSNDEQFIARFYQVIEQHFRSQALGVPLLAEKMQISERQLQRRVRNVTGKSPVRCLQDYRLDRAREQLLAGHSVGETAQSVGFSSHTYFSHCFKSKFGKTPRQLYPRKS